MTVLCLAYFWIDEGMHESKAEKAWKANVVTVLLLWINLDAALMFSVYIYTHVHIHQQTLRFTQLSGRRSLPRKCSPVS